MNDPTGYYSMITGFGIVAAFFTIRFIVFRKWRELELTFWLTASFGGALGSKPWMESLPDGDYLTNLMKLGFMLVLLVLFVITILRGAAYSYDMGYDMDY